MSPTVLDGSIVGLLAPGIVVTLELTAASTVLCFALSALIAVGRNSVMRPLSTGLALFNDTFRSVPLLALIYLIFFGLPVLSPTLTLAAFWAAVVAITLNQTAFSAEVYASAIRSVGPGQWDAARSIGLTRAQTFRRVVLPQAVIPSLAPTINSVMWIIKNTSLASLITVQELTLHADSAIALKGQPFKTYIILLGFYAVVTVPMGYLGRYLERRVGTALGGKARM